LKNFTNSIELYTKALEHSPKDHTIYGNRSAAFANLKQFTKALDDGQKCIDIKPDWSKGYLRKANALFGLRKLDEAAEACE
jgi:stress-induced-phosphoprotein 1